MKKFNYTFILIVTIFLCIFALNGCKKNLNLCDYVTELKSDCFVSLDQQYNLKATYGFIEDNHVNDGNVNKKAYLLTFKLLDKQTDNVTYTINLSYNQQEYSATFKLSPVSHTLVAVMEIEDFNLKQFDATLCYSSQSIKIQMQSIVPENAITYQQALSHLHQQQSALINSYLDQDNNFLGEITARILVKDQHPYWYIGLCDKDAKIKALLIDGIDGQLLAVRDIF